MLVNLQKTLIVIPLLIGVVLQADEVIAKVNGKNITKDDIKIMLGNNPNMNFDRLNADVQNKIIEQAIDRQLLTGKALKSKVQKSKEYKEALEKFKNNLTLNIWLKDKADNISISTKEMRSYYNNNKNSFTSKATIKARHILVDTEKAAKDIIKTLNTSKSLQQDFIQLAKDKSTGPSGRNGGDLGWFEREKMVPEFSAAAFALTKGQFTKQPVKTQFGYHVIYVEGKKKGGINTFSAVKPQIENILKGEKFQKFIKKETKQLRKKAKIKVLYNP